MVIILCRVITQRTCNYLPSRVHHADVNKNYLPLEIFRIGSFAGGRQIKTGQRARSDTTTYFYYASVSFVLPAKFITTAQLQRTQV